MAITLVPSWVTPIGQISSVAISIPTNINLLATATGQENEQTLTELPSNYQLIQGNLPTGLTLGADGVISGTPTPTATNIGEETYNFIIRATFTPLPGVVYNNGLNFIDGNFYITVYNKDSHIFEWATPAGNLGTVPDSEYFALQLSAIDTSGATITYSIISGDAPNGIRLSANGILQGIATILNPIAVDQQQTYRFTVRATSTSGKILDRGFNLTITNVYGPIIQPYAENIKYLGSFFDGDYFSQQLYVTEPNPEVKIQWSVSEGSLPNGVTLSDTGLLFGYLNPIQLSGAYGPQGYDGEEIDPLSGAILQDQEFDAGPYDFNNISQNLGSKFTIRAFDGANYDIQIYTMSIVSRSGLTADSTGTNNDSFITIDAAKYYVPILRDPSNTLPASRQDAYYAYKFDGYDPQGFQLTYSLVNQAGTFDAGVPGIDNGFDYGGDNVNHTSGVGFDAIGLIENSGLNNLPGLLLDANTGWLYGKINPTLAAITNYTFTLQVSKATPGGQVITSVPRVFVLPVLGDVNNAINWISPTDLGVINNGTVSELNIVAVSTEGKSLQYTLLDRAGFPCRLPQGLKMLPTGDISGRVTFESFSIDKNTTTIDAQKLTFDRRYNFYVEVATTDGTIQSIKEFTLLLNVRDTEPYNNLYLKALPAFDQRQIYNSIISDTNIFDPALIYRYGDDWFGIRPDIQMLFITGLTTTELDNYATAIEKNHWTKTYKFGDILTASVLDEYYKVKYEVVYIEVMDPEENTDSTGPGLEINLQGVIKNPYIDSNGTQFKKLYPNTTSNMATRLKDGIGYFDESTLPAWMTSNQPSTGTASFKPPLGYTKAVVLAYTVPGAAKLIAYRLKNSGINFNNIQFTADRYEVDNYYSTNFNYDTREFLKGTETTFDHTPHNVGEIVGTATYAVEGVPFDQINGRPISYINSAGGIDGTNTYLTGDTLIFVQQEQYSLVEPFDGWGIYTDAWIGDNTQTVAIEGYSSEPFDNYTVIPGFLEKAQGTAPYNKRGGIWEINIINGIVNLVFKQEIQVNQRVQIIRGGTFGGAVMYYNPTIPTGQTVPYYVVYKITPPALDPKTTFNGNSTRFFSFKDQYYVPGTQDKYLKFPQDGAFN